MFEGFDSVQPPDQWDEITTRAADPAGPAFEPGRGGRGRAILVGAVAAAVGVAGVLWIGLGDGDDFATVGTPADTVPEATSPTTTAPPTTVELPQPPMTSSRSEIVSVTTAPPATSETPTTPPVAPAFECNESVITAAPDGVYEDDPALEHFGPLGAAPALDITTGWPGLLNENADVTRVSGGTAVVLHAGWSEPGWSLTVINDDGSIRWRRCSLQTALGQVLPTAHALVVAETPDPAAPYPPPTTWRLLDNATGADAGVLDIPADDYVLLSFDDVTSAARFVLFGKTRQYDPAGVIVPLEVGETLRILDTETMALTALPYPLDFYSGARSGSWIQLDGSTVVSDGWILKEHGDEYPTVKAVFVDGAWSTDPGVVRSAVATAAFSGDRGWSGFDPFGNVVWTIPDKQVYITEGPEWREDGDLDLLSVCARYESTEDGGIQCVSPGLLGVEGETGTILWELAGHRQIAAVGDGYAIVDDGTLDPNAARPAGGWSMIDTETGLSVEGQVWPDFETFDMGGSMEEDGMWVRRDGGVVIAVNGEHIRVWMPAGYSNGTIDVSLAS